PGAVPRSRTTERCSGPPRHDDFPTGCSTYTSGWPPAPAGCRPPGGGSPARSRSRTRVTSATSSRPISTCEPCSPPTPTWSSWATTACVAERAEPTPVSTQRWPRRSGPERSQPSPRPGLPSSPAPTQGASCTSPERGSTFAIRSTSSPGRSMAADLDDIRSRLEAIAEELADMAMEALRDAIEAGEQRRPAEERRLTQARRSVERAASLLQAEDDVGG